MRTAMITALLLVATLAAGASQSQFVGKWQTRVSRVTNKSSITVIILKKEQTFGGAVVLGNPDGSEIELPILNAKASGNVIEFETVLKTDTFHWNLTVKKTGSSRGLLHGSCREMLIGETVKKHEVMGIFHQQADTTHTSNSIVDESGDFTL
jgi:hypothetical protein